MRETRKKWQHSVINAMTSVRTRNRKWSCVGSGRGLIYLEWSEEIAQAVVSELDFEESVVILMVKNSGAAFWEEGVIYPKPKSYEQKQLEAANI